MFSIYLRICFYLGALLYIVRLGRKTISNCMSRIHLICLQYSSLSQQGFFLLPAANLIYNINSGYMLCSSNLLFFSFFPELCSRKFINY